MFQRFDITNTNAAPKTTSNPTTVQVLSEKSHYRDDRNSAIATAETRILKQRRIKNPVNAVQIAAPAARVALTGSIVSLLPLGSYTAMFSILAMSIVSRRLQSQAVGCVVAFLHAGGLSGLEGQVLALLSFISFSAVLDSLDGPLHAIYKSSIHDIELVQDTLTAICVSMFFELLVLFSAIFFALHRIFTNAPRFTAASWSRRLSTESFADEESDGFGLGVGLGVTWDAVSQASQEALSTFSSPSSNCGASRGELFKDSEMVEDACDDEARIESRTEDAERRTQALFGDVNRLIDDCNGLDTAQWDEVIAALHEPQGVGVVEDRGPNLDRSLAASAARQMP
ncbi:hypothetical protein ACJQWK_11544 [Exserohilum turcicum]